MSKSTILTITLATMGILISSCQQYIPVYRAGHEVTTPMSETR